MNNLLSSPLRNLAGGVLYMLAVMACSTTAYVATGWSLGDAVYMVVLTVYTVGYDEVRPIDTPTLRVITVSLIVLGCTGMIFLTGALVQLITATQLQQILGAKRMQGQIERMAGHVVICGFGRIGMMLARELHGGGVPFIVLERSEERLGDARERGYLCLACDATEETALEQAGVGRARALATVLPNDAANVFITLSARNLNPQLTIIARGELPSTERKLLHAGASRVVMPAQIGAERIAELILYPSAARLLHSSAEEESFARDLRLLGLEVETIAVEAGSRCAGMTVAAVDRAAEGAFLIVGINRLHGESLTRPASDVVLAAGDGVVLLGRPNRAAALVGLFQAAGSGV